MRKIGCFIGRFAPFHKGHYKIVKDALAKTDYLVFSLGSHNKSINTHDPLTTDERIQIIKASLTEEEVSRVRFVYIEDHEYNLDRWIASVQTAAFNANLPWSPDPSTIYLVGMKKDNSSYYLNLFRKSFKSIVSEIGTEENVLSSTTIRNNFYENMLEANREHFVTKEAYDLFNKFMSAKPNLIYEHRYEVEYKTNWGPGPHVTVDSCVVQAGHVLLIQRGKEYGHKKWALPGGFINKDELTLDASLRELDEETKIKLPKKVLRGSLVSSKLYDYPYRSNRARILTHTFYYRLSDNNDFPDVKGSDDAIDAKWVPISEFLGMRSVMFEDHYSMICDTLKL